MHNDGYPENEIISIDEYTRLGHDCRAVVLHPGLEENLGHVEVHGESSPEQRNHVDHLTIPRATRTYLHPDMSFCWKSGIWAKT